MNFKTQSVEGDSRLNDDWLIPSPETIASFMTSSILKSTVQSIVNHRKLCPIERKKKTFTESQALDENLRDSKKKKKVVRHNAWHGTTSPRIGMATATNCSRHVAIVYTEPRTVRDPVTYVWKQRYLFGRSLSQEIEEHFFANSRIHITLLFVILYRIFSHIHKASSRY